MKQLLLIRHAKAADETAAGDFMRPLKNSGKEDALTLAKRLAKAGIIPQVIYSSPALRAKTTADIIAEFNNITTGEPVAAIYEASDGILLKIINGLPNQYNFVALTGHNPAFSTVGSYLTAQYHSLPTCGAILINFEADSWDLISAATGKAAWVSEP